MAKVWVLDTETKGTGAQMVPLEKALERKRGKTGGDRITVIRRERDSEPTAGAAEVVAPRPPRRFKVRNAVSRKVLADGVGMQEALEALAPLRSVVDATVYVWEPEEDEWRPLTIGEQKALWEHRGEATRR
jgi:hypothetical protein